MLSIAKTSRRILFNLKSEILNLKLGWAVLKNELEEGILVGFKVRQSVGAFEGKNYFLFFGYEGLILLKIFTRHFLQAVFSQADLLQLQK